MPKRTRSSKKSFSRKRPATRRRRLVTGAAGLAATAGLYVAGKAAKAGYSRLSSYYQKRANKKAKLMRLNKGVNKATQGESYVASHSAIIGTKAPIVGDFKDKLFNVLYPPRLFTYHGTQRLDVESGKQNVISYTYTSSLYLDDPSQKMRDLLSNSNGFVGVNNTEVSGDITTDWNRVYLNYSSCLSTFYNSSTTTCEFDVYVYKTKHSSWQQVGTSDNRNNYPNMTWNNAEIQADNYNDSQAFTTVFDSINTVGYKPTSEPYKHQMDKFWKLMDKESVILMPGQSHKHYVRDQHPRDIRQYDMNNFKNLEDITYYIMVVAKGQVVTTNTAANNFITTGPAQLSIAVVAKNQFRVIPLQQATTHLVTEFQQFTDAQVDVINQFDREKHNYEEDA